MLRLTQSIEALRLTVGGFCFADGEGTAVTIAGLGLVPGPDKLKVRLGATVYEQDSYNNLTVSVVPGAGGALGDTVVRFFVPDLAEPGTADVTVSDGSCEPAANTSLPASAGRCALTSG